AWYLSTMTCMVSTVSPPHQAPPGTTPSPNPVDPSDSLTCTSKIGCSLVVKAEFYQLASELAATEAQQRQYELNQMEALVSSSNIRAVAHRARTLDTRAPNMWRDSLLGYLAIHQGRRNEAMARFSNADRSEEHTSELQSRFDLVC